MLLLHHQMSQPAMDMQQQQQQLTLTLIYSRLLLHRRLQQWLHLIAVARTDRPGSFVCVFSLFYLSEMFF